MAANYHNPAFDGRDVAEGTSKHERDPQGHNPHEESRNTIVLLGSGDMAMALAMNFIRAKLHPVIVSRNPERAKDRFKKKMILDAKVMTIEEGLSMGDIVIVAIPSDRHGALPPQKLRNKILVDISNRAPSAPSGDYKSNAEKLQDLLPESHVVKAFNTLSSYALSQGIIQGSREVPICGESEWARNRVSSLVRDIGLIPVDQGALKNSRAVEDIPMSFFPEWKTSFILSLCLFIFYFLLVLFGDQLCPNIENKNSTSWDLQPFNELPLLNIQTSLATTATTLLLVTYIPGCLAAYIQLFRGTKYSQFPDWLDNWMKSRKQFGLLALLLGGLHGCMAIFSLMSWGMSYFWRDQLYCMAGSVLLAVLAVLGVTSLPSVSARLTWREFSNIQSFLGWASVVLVTLHGGAANWPYLFNKPSCVVIPSAAQVTMPLCLLTLLLKIPLLVPCVNWYLMKIRNGYERAGSEPSAA